VGRNGTFDYARLIAAFGIVIFHADAPGAAIGYAGLPFFLILLVVLGGPVAQRMHFANFAATRVRRLLRPWLIWSAIYGGLKLAEVAVTGQPLATEFTPAMILTGPALHLWFMPFAFVASLGLYGVIRLRRVWPTPVLCAALLMVGLALLGLQQERTFAVPIAQWVFAGPAVCLGCALALLHGAVVRQAMVVAGVVVIALTLGWSVGVVQIAVAGCTFIACAAWPRPATPGSDWAAQIAMGVYLTHPLMLSCLDRATTLQPGTIGIAVVAGLGALLLGALLQALARSTKRVWPSPAGWFANTQRP